MHGLDWGNLSEKLIKDKLAQDLLAPIKVEGDPEMPNIELRVVGLEGEPIWSVAQRL